MRVQSDIIDDDVDIVAEAPLRPNDVLAAPPAATAARRSGDSQNQLSLGLEPFLGSGML